MSQHDYVLANQSGASFRSDANNALGAVQSNNSSATQPTATVAYQWWGDTSATAMRVRNPGNTLFIKVFKMTTSTVIPYIVGSTGGGAQLGSAIVQRTINNKFTKGQRGAISSVAYASSITLNLNNANNFKINNLTGNLTLANPSAMTAAVGQGGSIWIPQGTVGNRTVSFGAMWKFPAGVAPVASTASSKVDRVDYKVRNASTIDASYTVGIA